MGAHKTGRPFENPERFKHRHAVAEPPVRDGELRFGREGAIKPQPRMCAGRIHRVRKTGGAQNRGNRPYAIHP